MEWSDHAFVLSARPHGETAALVSVLTLNHGRWLGRVSGAQTGAKKAWLGPCSTVNATWRARLDEQLGTFKLELETHTAAHVFENRAALLALDYMAALVETVTPERLPLPLLFQALGQVVHAVQSQANIFAAVALFERSVLDVMGYGLDVSVCAVTGTTDDLVAISPQSGRAVSRTAAMPYEGRLLPLPAFWLAQATAGDAANAGVDAKVDIGQLAESFRVTGYFLEQHFYQHPKAFPVQRAQLLSLLAAGANVSAA